VATLRRRRVVVVVVVEERFCEELRQEKMAFVQQQSEYMAAYNAQTQQAMNVNVLFILNTVVYLCCN
jgi:hypothetical protein